MSGAQELSAFNTTGTAAGCGAKGGVVVVVTAGAGAAVVGCAVCARGCWGWGVFWEVGGAATAEAVNSTVSAMVRM